MKKTKSYFKDILVKLILMLCIPLLSIGLIYWRADRTVKEQLQVSATKTLKLYSEQMDKVFDEVRNACVTAFGSSMCRSYYTALEGSSMQVNMAREISQLLRTLSQECFYDIFVYFNHNDKILSGVRGTLKAEYYYETYYAAASSSTYYSEKNNPDFEDEFMNIIKADSGKLTCHVMNSQGEESLLCVTMANRINNVLNYTICVVLDPRYIEKMFVMEEMEEFGVFQVYNSEHVSVMSTGVNIAMGDLMHENIGFNIWTEFDGYMLQLKKSNIMDNYYSYAVEIDYFWDVLQVLRYSSFSVVFLCVFISILYAYASAKKVYSPIKGMISSLLPEKSSEFIFKEKSEFAYIESLMKNSKKEHNKMKKELLIRKLLDGSINYSDDENILESLAENEGFMIIMLQIEEVPGNLDKLGGFIVQNVLSELCNEVGTSYCLEVFSDRYVLIVGSVTNYNKLCSAIEEGQNYIKQFFQIILTVGCSSLHKEIPEMPTAYKEAKEAIKYRFLVGVGEKIYYEEIHEKKNNYQREREKKIYLLLTDYVRREESDINEFLEDLMYIYQMDEDVTVDVALFFKNKVCWALEKIIISYKSDRKKYDELLNLLQVSDTLDEFRKQLSFCVEELKEDYRRETNSSAKKEIREKARAYIDTNYNDSQMSVNVLGEQLGIQAAYLSKCFREEYGISILNYLASVRIMHAKNIILSENKSIQEVTEKTGFSSSHVFIRTFKKIEGITPGKFKELVKNEEKSQ